MAQQQPSPRLPLATPSLLRWPPFKLYRALGFLSVLIASLFVINLRVGFGLFSSTANGFSSPVAAFGTPQICGNATTAQAETEARIAALESRLHDAPHRSLPVCDELMSRPNSPYADGAFLTRRTTPHSWTPRADGSRQFDLLVTCSIKRYTAADARQCLGGRHLALIGDSLTRYQYLSLAYFLEYERWPDRFGMPPVRKATRMPLACQHIDEQGRLTCSERPNVCMEGDYAQLHGINHGWDMYFHDLGGGPVGGDGGVFHGRMECQCVRGPRPGRNVNNMMYVSPPAGEEEGRKAATHRTKITFLNEQGWGDRPDPVNGWNFTGCAHSGRCRFPNPGQNNTLWTKPLDWSQDFSDSLGSVNGVLHRVLPEVDIALYNRGSWGALKKDRAEKIFPQLFEFVGGSRGRCLFKGTTAHPKARNLIEPEQLVHEVAQKVGCGVLDLAHVTDEFSLMGFYHPKPPKQEGGRVSSSRERDDVYWDSVHFMPWVYEELNQVMLNVLCNPFADVAKNSTE